MSRRLTIEEVKRRLKDISPLIEILSEEYVNAHTKLRCRCLVDGHEWYATWASLSRHHGCPTCSGRITGGINEIKSRLHLINNNISLLERVYINNTTPMSCKCKVCGHKWKTTWGSLRQGCGCPTCANNLRLTIEDIKIQLYKINKNIEILSTEYVNNYTLLKCRCKIDGHIWYKSWNKLKQGIGCAKCAGVLKLTLNDIKADLDIISPNLIILSKEYFGSESKLEVECNVCKHTWYIRWSKLKEGIGCPECAKENMGWTKTSWLNKAKASNYFDSFKVYVLKCWNDDMSEVFYKIGRTFTKVSRRYMSDMPYNYKIIKIVESEDCLYIYDLENELKRVNKKNRVSTDKYFSGHTECFSNIEVVEHYLRDKKRKDG